MLMGGSAGLDPWAGTWVGRLDWVERSDPNELHAAVDGSWDTRRVARRGVAAALCGAMVMGLISACAAGTSRGEGSMPTETPHAQQPRAGSTSGAPTPSTSPGTGVATNRLVGTRGPVNRPSAKVSALIARLTPSQFALDKSGYLLVTYTDQVWGIKAAWRLYGPEDNVIAEGRGGAGPTVVGKGFLLFQRAVKYLDRRGRLTIVAARESYRRPTGPGDTLVPDLEMAFNFRRKELFVGTAVPNGVVTLTDGKGRFWALGKRTDDRTVVRFARPGGPWRSRALGPRIGARRVSGAGKLLMVTGMKRMYLSPDGGKKWRLLRHGASAYSGIPEFGITADGSIAAGDERAGWRISHDLKTFHDATPGEVAGAFRVVTTRGRGTQSQMSVDAVHWEAFSIPALRRLLSPTSR